VRPRTGCPRGFLSRRAGIGHTRVLRDQSARLDSSTVPAWPCGIPQVPGSRLRWPSDERGDRARLPERGLGCGAEPWCAVRRCVTEWRWKTCTVGLVVARQRSWGQPDPGGAGEGGSSPDDAGTGQYCQMVWVRLARCRGIREEPVLTPLNAPPARTWWIGAGRGAYPLFVRDGELWGRAWGRLPGGCEEVLRRTRSDAAGEKPGAY
jgi:hypothetical protein